MKKINVSLKASILIIMLLAVFFSLCFLSVAVADDDYAAEYDPEVLEAFENQTWVRVIVKVTDNTGIYPTTGHTEEERRSLIDEKTRLLNSVTDEVLSTLYEDEFKLKTRFLLGNGFSGNITKAGFDKLIENSNVAKIHFFKMLYIQPVEVRDYPEEESSEEPKNASLSNFSSLEEKQELKIIEKVESKSWFSNLIQFFKSLFKLE